MFSFLQPVSTKPYVVSGKMSLKAASRELETTKDRAAAQPRKSEIRVVLDYPN